MATPYVFKGNKFNTNMFKLLSVEREENKTQSEA